MDEIEIDKEDLDIYNRMAFNILDKSNRLIGIFTYTEDDIKLATEIFCDYLTYLYENNISVDFNSFNDMIKYGKVFRIYVTKGLYAIFSPNAISIHSYNNICFNTNRGKLTTFEFMKMIKDKWFTSDEKLCWGMLSGIPNLNEYLSLR